MDLHEDRGSGPVPAAIMQEGKAPRGDGKHILWRKTELSQAYVLNRSVEEKKEMCLVPGLQSH